MSAPVNRIRTLLAHIPNQEFWFHAPQKKLAQAVGLSESRLSKIINGRVKPRYSEVLKLVEFFESHYHKKIDPREVYHNGGEDFPVGKEGA
jgi:transcriptional regulator with XRE-family HTH domain